MNLKSKHLRLALIAFILITMVVMILILASRRQVEELPPPISPPPSFTSFSQISEDFSPPQYTQPPTKSDGSVDTESTAVETAIQAKNDLSSHLPIYIENFTTSVGILTTINIYSIPQDPDYLIHLDIYGINYHHASVDETINPHMTAFKESFIHAKEKIKEKGIDLQDIYFIFGGRQYIQETAEDWINALGLL